VWCNSIPGWLHICVQPEQVGRVVLIFDLNQALEITLVVLVDPRGGLIIDVIGIPAARERLEILPEFTDIGDMARVKVWD
jgi:hypothetical protein